MSARDADVTHGAVVDAAFNRQMHDKPCI